MQWAAARADWEGDPSLSDGAVGKRYGVTGAAIQKRRLAESWTRIGALAGIVQAAHIKADAKSKVDGYNQKVEEIVGAASLAMSEDIRAKIIEQHREQWDALEPDRLAAKRLLTSAMNVADGGSETHDPEKGLPMLQQAKIAQEAVHKAVAILKDMQEGRAKAWGLDAIAPDDGGGSLPAQDYGKVKAAARTQKKIHVPEKVAEDEVD